MLPTTARKAGPYSCNGSVVDFDFAFKVYTTDDIRVVKTTSAGVESDLTLTSHYTVSLNADQDNDPGGTITTVATYASGNKITIVGDTDYGQPTDITNRGGFYPDVIMKMVDRVVIMAQQLKEGLDRSVKVDVSSTTDPADLLDDITTSVAAAAASETAAASSASAASTSASAASTSATNASNSASAAAASAASVNITTPSGNAIVLRSTGATDVTLPTSGTLARTADKLSVFAATTSAELAGVLSDETGTGAAVFANTPTLVTPNIGAATGTSLNLSGAATAAGLVGGAVDNTMVGGRLTLASGTPVTTSDQTAKTTVYYTPYIGNRIALYASGAWTLYPFTELSVAVPSNTNTPFDVFIYDNAGTLALEVVAWSSDTARATELTTQDGVYVKSGSTDRRYLGTGRTTSVSGQTEDSAQRRLLFNAYNRVRRTLKKVETTASWSYATTSFRVSNNSSSNYVDVMAGLAEIEVDLVNNQLATQSGSNTVYIGIGYDQTTGTDADTGGVMEAVGQRTPLVATLAHNPSLGRHYYAPVERGATGCAFHGAYGAAPSHGLTGSVTI